MSEVEDWIAVHERHKKFLETELGLLYHQYTNALIDYWRQDANDDVSNKRLMELDARAKLAEKLFKDKLMELAGV